uniref:Uncharacterized protein n=1 Tax=Arundo donax TaxID=35708 RepID=A0A0A9DJ45_ARUDO
MVLNNQHTIVSPLILAKSIIFPRRTYMPSMIPFVTRVMITLDSCSSPIINN